MTDACHDHHRAQPSGTPPAGDLPVWIGAHPAGSRDGVEGAVMLVLAAGSASELFAAACAAVRAQGAPVAPRGMATVELLGAHLCLTDPRRRLVELAPVRVLNPAFAAAETVWILSGSDAPWIYTYNRRLGDYCYVP